MLAVWVLFSDTAINYLQDSQTILVVVLTSGLMLLVAKKYSALLDHIAQLQLRKFHAVVGIAFLSSQIYLHKTAIEADI